MSNSTVQRAMYATLDILKHRDATKETIRIGLMTEGVRGVNVHNVHATVDTVLDVLQKMDLVRVTEIDTYQLWWDGAETLMQVLNPVD